MYVAGFDIGTTSVCCVVADTETGGRIAVLESPNDAGLPPRADWERAQDPKRIVSIIDEMIERLGGVWAKVEAIGISCQMHGMLYVNGRGEAVSPLYTWQDGRGDLRMAEEDMTYAAYMTGATGYRAASGYGLATHFYNVRRGLVPPSAVRLCTIGDYAAMQLCGSSVPLTDASNAASLGLFDLAALRFDQAPIRALGIDPGILPPVAGPEAIAGRTADGKLVACAFGDNQASFLGSVPSLERSMLVNVGTGAQLSAYSESPEPSGGLDVRPFPGGGYLLVGASLGGGKSYALLEAFFRDVVYAFGGRRPEAGALYERMNELARDALAEEGAPLRVAPHFFGTRTKPGMTGSIGGIGAGNWTAKRLVLGFLDGMAEELLAFADALPGKVRRRIDIAAASGNGIRKNLALRQLLERRLGYPLHLSPIEEEAALGAAIYAGVRAGAFPGREAAIARFQRKE